MSLYGSKQGGTATSRSSLKRVIRRLTATLSNLRGSSTDEHRGLDYASLVSLCDSSRTDAIRAMTDLSSRLSARSHLGSSCTRSANSRGSSRSHCRKRNPGVGTNRRSSSRGGPRTSHEARDKRVSNITMSTNSTKLGELRHLGVSHGQGSKAAYPRRLQKHNTPAKNKKR